MKNKSGFVYLICDPKGDRFKIGVTNGSLEKRIKKLQTGNSNELFVSSYYSTEYPFRMETMLHNKYKDKKVINEWFELSATDVANFINTCKEIEEVIKSLSNNTFFMDDIR